MRRSLYTLSVILLSLNGVLSTPIARDSSPVGSLSIARQLNFTRNIVQADQARAKALVRRGRKVSKHKGHHGHGEGHDGHHRRVTSSFQVNNGAVTYTANVGIGNPPTQYTLIVDTGSANTWVGAGKPYLPTLSSRPTLQPVSVTYGSGSFTGLEWYDQVTLNSRLVIGQQSIGQAITSQGFGGVDGILGVGPTDLTTNTLTLQGGTIPTVTDNLWSQHTLTNYVMSVSFQPTSSISVENGVLTFGGTNSNHFTGSIGYTPITSTIPAREFWGIDQSISYGGNVIMTQTAGIVDTGTTLILLPNEAFNAYQAQTGATVDSNTGLLTITASQYANLQPLNFNVNGNTYGLPPNGQIWPRALNTAIGGNANSIYLIVNSMGSNIGSGLDFINGYAFLERFYSVFDSGNSQVGFAYTPYTYATTN